MHTSIAKTKTGWQGNTRVLIGDSKVLIIQTAKASDGSLVTVADVRQVKRLPSGPMEVSKRHDYCKHWMRWKVRATERQVREQHTEALAMLDDRMPDIDKHYSVDRG
jgi:hypothetical protein